MSQARFDQSRPNMNLARQQPTRRVQSSFANSASRVNTPRVAGSNRQTIGQQLTRFGNGRGVNRSENSGTRLALAGLDTNFSDPFIPDGSPTSTVVNNTLRDEINGAATALRNFYMAWSQAAVNIFTKMLPENLSPIGDGIDNVMDQIVKDTTGTEFPLLEPGTPVSLPTQNAPSFDTSGSGFIGTGSSDGNSSGNSLTSGDTSSPATSVPPSLPVPPAPADASTPDPGTSMQDPSLDSSSSGSDQDQSSDSSQSDDDTSMQ